ncbi:MAG: hypothetical protein Q9162_001893 [Coniocarpon cinnabarinum]
MQDAITIQPLKGCPGNCVKDGDAHQVTGGVFHYTPPSSDSGCGFGFNLTQGDDQNYSNNFCVVAGSSNNGLATSTTSLPPSLPSCPSTPSSSTSSAPATAKGNSTVNTATPSATPASPATVSSSPVTSSAPTANTRLTTFASPLPSTVTENGQAITATNSLLVTQTVDSQVQAPTMTATYLPGSPIASPSVVSQVGGNQPQAPAPALPSYQSGTSVTAIVGPAVSTSAGAYIPSGATYGASTPGPAHPQYTGGAVSKASVGTELLIAAAAGIGGFFAMA